MPSIKGRVWKFGDSVDTDVISPGGARDLNLREHAMTALRPEFPSRVQPGDIVVGGRNFGCGSHRKTVNSILWDLGVAAIIAESVARLFFRVGISMVMPTYAAPGITGIVEDGDELEIDAGQGFARNTATGKSVALTKYPPSVEEIFAAGGIVEVLRRRLARGEGGERRGP